MILQFLLNGLITGSIYALVSIGFALVYNTTRIFHIAYAVLYMVAPYLLMSALRSFGLPVVMSLVVAISLTVLLSVVIELGVYRPLEEKNSSSNIVMISAIGVMIVVINAIALIYGNETQILNPDISQSIHIGNVIVTYTQLMQLVVSGFLILAFLFFLRFSRFGITTRALRDDKELCEVYGMNARNFRVVLFALSGFFAAAGGLLVSWDVGMDPYVGMPMLLNAVVALIIGGIGKFHAPVIGGLLLGVLQALSVMVFSANWKDAITFGVLVLFLLFRPQGFIGEKRRLV
ncbi:MAG: branched-chain amino acid ABC transporter permease [Marinifilaceae bacterium]